MTILIFLGISSMLNALCFGGVVYYLRKIYEKMKEYDERDF